MIELQDSYIVAPELDDRMLCQIAVEASSPTKSIMPISVNDPVFYIGEEWTPRVLKGLAWISLHTPGYDYSGVGQAKADFFIGELSGDVDEFFRPILLEAT